MRSRLIMVLIVLAMTMPALTVTAQVAPADAFGPTWERTDKPVADGQATRTWMWGPQPFTDVISEPYVESPGGSRNVQYFDKSRMEITNPGGDSSSIWHVTNGLLATELITGQLQLGNNQFEDRAPADIPVAGDADDVDGPTYAAMANVANLPTFYDLGEEITASIGGDGAWLPVSPVTGHGVTAAYYDDVTDLTIASAFWDFMNSEGIVWENDAYVTDRLFENPFYATGRPVTEAFWATVKVGGEVQSVLLQCFERRCLTFTPGNASEWQVEAGNVGQHYRAWRYDNQQGLSELIVHYIDVGQGDATLIQGDDVTILIDAGDYRRNEVVPYLQSVGVTELDLLVGTHPDADHIGQIPQVMEAFDVDEVWLSGDEHTTQTFERALDAVLESDADYHEPRAGETFTFGSLGVEVVHPEALTGDFNENSISLRAVYGDIRFMFTGDAESESEQEMVGRGHALESEILHVGHHGSSTSTSAAFLDSVNPEVAIYSAGTDNQFGHPNEDVIGRLLDRGIEVYGTDINGSVRVQTDGESYSVLTEHDGQVQAPSQPVLPPPIVDPPITEPDPPATGCVNINTASHEELQEIIHIGPERATEIIRLRPFSSVDDLIRVTGIGEVRLQDIKDQGVACISGSATVPPPPSDPGETCTATTQAEIVSVSDGLGNTNPNSWAQGTGGDWIGGLDAAPEISVGTTLNISVAASGECSIEYRFQKQPVGGSFVTLRDWSSNATFTYTIKQEDAGTWFLVIPEIRDTDPRTRFDGVDDYNYLSYVVD